MLIFTDFQFDKFSMAAILDFPISEAIFSKTFHSLTSKVLYRNHFGICPDNFPYKIPSDSFCILLTLHLDGCHHEFNRLGFCLFCSKNDSHMLMKLSLALHGIYLWFCHLTLSSKKFEWQTFWISSFPPKYILLLYIDFVAFPSNGGYLRFSCLALAQKF